MRVIGCRVGEDTKLEVIENGLEAMQKYVGGLIQYLPLDDEVAIICNDEGKLLNLPWNRPLFADNGNLLDVICGDFFICGAPWDSDELTDIPENRIADLMERFA